MLSVITGISGSGKSEYAENRAVELSGGENLYYVATMEPYGEEGRQRVERHRKLRAGKGFTTIECYRDVESVVDVIGPDQCGNATILLECMSNLLANEMFPAGQERSIRAEELVQIEELARTQEAFPTGGQILDKLLSGMSFISRQCKHLIIVTNEVFLDGNDYEEETIVYIKCMGVANQSLIEMADEGIEVVYTVPMMIKTNNYVNYNALQCIWDTADNLGKSGHRKDDI